MASDRGPRPDPRADPITIPPAPATGTSSLPPYERPSGHPSFGPSSESRRSFAPSSRRGDLGSSGALRRQLAQLQMQLAEMQRQMAEQQEERAADADRIAEMLAAIVRLESSNRAAEARLRESEERDTEAKVAIRTLEGALSHTRSELELSMNRVADLTRQLEAVRNQLAESERQREELAASRADAALREELDAELVKNATLESRLNAERAQHQRALDQLRKDHGAAVANIRQGHTEAMEKLKRELQERIDDLARMLDKATAMQNEAEAAVKKEKAERQRLEKELAAARDEAKAAKDATEAARKQKDGIAAELAGARAAARASESKAEAAHRAAEIARGEAAAAQKRIADLERARDEQVKELARITQEFQNAEAIATNLRAQFEGSEELLAKASSSLDRLERGELELAMVRASALAAAKELVMHVAAARALIDPSRAADAMRALGRLSRRPPAPTGASEPPPFVPPPAPMNPNATTSVTVGVVEVDESDEQALLGEDERSS